MHAFIAPYARGHGLARLLTERVEEGARALGYSGAEPGCARDPDGGDRDVRVARLHPLGHPSGLRASRRADHPRHLLLQAAATWRADRLMALTLYPAIDLKDGACVRLRRGEMAEATVYSDDPGAQARTWQDAGCRWLHVVDLNGAFAGRPVNARCGACHPGEREHPGAARRRYPRPGRHRGLAGGGRAPGHPGQCRGQESRSSCARPAAPIPAASPSASTRATASLPPRAGRRPRRCAALDLALRFEDAGAARSSTPISAATAC